MISSSGFIFVCFGENFFAARALHFFLYNLKLHLQTLFSANVSEWEVVTASYDAASTCNLMRAFWYL